MSSQIEEIKSRTDVADLVGSYLKLQKAGVNFKARCPFHNERSASFFISPARQIWHCFGCQKGGDVFKFIMEIEGCEFREALNILASRAGIELKKELPQIRDEREKQFAILEEATKFFESNLVVGPLSYLKNRGLTEETIREFRLGYALDDWRCLFNHLSGKGFKEADIEKTGLIIGTRNQGQGSRYYDRFRGRIMFPIFNQSGKVIAFGGRIYPEKNDSAKYVNSPETPLYQKSKTLYGFHKSKIEILRAESCVIVEGYMDFLSVFQSDTKNAVASSGTALTSDQLKILRRICEKITVAFDMDEAGETASRRGIELALKEGFDVKVLKLGEDFKDPADVILKDKNLWNKYLQNSRHIVQFYIDSALKKFNAGSPELGREIQKNVLPVVSNLFSDLEQAHWVREISQILSIKEEVIWSALQKIRPVIRQDTTSDDGAKFDLVLKPQTRKELLENRILGMAAKHPEFLEKKISHLEPQLFSGDKRTAFAEIRNGSSGFKDFISRLVLEAELFLEGVADAEAEFIKCAKELKKEHLKERMGLLSAKINYAENRGENISEFLSEFKAVSEQIKKI